MGDLTRGSNFGQFGRGYDRITFTNKAASIRLVVEGASMHLCVAVARTEVAFTSTKNGA